MPRYIDADKLIAEYDRVHIGAPGEARKLMVDAPTADVAPKSEVAREIFEEIEKHIQEKKKAISMFKDGEDDFYDGEIHALEVFAHLLAKLKKKYTEDQT